ncbi:otoancorin [Diretmus argenteus]
MRGDSMEPEDYDGMVWAAKPLLQNILTTKMNLPSTIERPRMAIMMKMLKEVFGSLSEEQRVQVKDWVKKQVIQMHFNCTRKPTSSSESVAAQKPPTSRPKIHDHSWGNNETDDEEEKDMNVTKRCPPRLMWLKMEALKAMGPYLSRLRLDDVSSSPKDELCQFFNSSQFKPSFSEVPGMKPFLARTFLQRVQECSSDKMEFTQHVGRLGMLACFYDDPPMTMSTNLTKHLLSELSDCNNSRIKRLKKHLVRALMSSSMDTASPALLRDLGSGATMLSPDELSKFPVSAIKEALTTLGSRVRWRWSQAKQLAKKLLGGRKEVSGEELMSMGSVVRGLPTSLLKTVHFTQDILGKEGLNNITNEMSKGQRKAVLEGLHSVVNASELVQKAPDPLLSSVSLHTLVKANLTSLDQIEGKHWNRAHVGCAARKLFTKLEKVRPGYFHNITKEELDEIPTLLLIHLPPRKVKVLPDSVCPVFLDKMKEANLSSLPPGAPSRPALTQRALQCLANGGNISGLSSEEVSRLGPLLCELPPYLLSLMAPEALNASLQSMASCPQTHPRHRSWLKEVLSDLKDTLSQAPVSPPPDLSALRKKLFFLSINPPSARRKREVDSINDTVPTVELIEELSEDNIYWTPAQLEKMTVETFTSTVETLGAIPDYSTDQLAMLKEKATQAWGPVTHMNESVVIQLGCVSQGFSDTDLEQLPISLDTLEAIAHCGWNESQIKAVWNGFAKHSNLTAGDLGAVEIVALNQFICGLSSDDIGQLNVDAFKEAVNSMDDVQCSLLVTKQFKELAVAAFGQPSNWTEADVSTLGNIMAGLDAAELGSLDPSVFSFLSKSSIPLIPADNFAALSVSQLDALGPDNAAMVTNAQRAAMGAAQRAALDNAQTGTRAEPQNYTSPPTPESGAPSLSIEGVAAFMKPFLFLLLGFLLL